MKWFDRWFYNKVRWCWTRASSEHPDWKAAQDALDEAVDTDSQDNEVEPVGYSYDNSHMHSLEDGLIIAIKSLHGGFIVTVTHNDDLATSRLGLTDPNKSSYIITDQEDFDSSLCKILSMERLKK